MLNEQQPCQVQAIAKVYINFERPTRGGKRHSRGKRQSRWEDAQSLRQATESLGRDTQSDKVAGQRATKSLRQATESLKTANILIQLEILFYRIVWLLVEMPRCTEPALDVCSTRRRHCSNVRCEKASDKSVPWSLNVIDMITD
jgi:hypothetical protein